MAARLDDDGSRLRDVDAKHFEEHRVGRLAASGDHDHREAPDPQRSGGSNINTTALQQAEPADEATIAEANHISSASKGTSHCSQGAWPRLRLNRAANFAPMPNACA